MTTMTLRGIDDTIAIALKDKARQEESSVNAVMLRILRESLGIDKKKRSAVFRKTADRFFLSIPSDSLRILSITALTLDSSCRALSFNAMAMVSSIPRSVMVVMGLSPYL